MDVLSTQFCIFPQEHGASRVGEYLHQLANQFPEHSSQHLPFGHKGLSIVGLKNIPEIIPLSNIASLPGLSESLTTSLDTYSR